MWFNSKKKKIKKIEECNDSIINKFKTFFEYIKLNNKNLIDTDWYNEVRREYHKYGMFYCDERFKCEFDFYDIDKISDLINSEYDRLSNFIAEKYLEINSVVNRIVYNKIKWPKSDNEIPKFFEIISLSKPNIHQYFYSSNLKIDNDGNISGIVFSAFSKESYYTTFKPQNDQILPLNKKGFNFYLNQRLNVMKFSSEKEMSEYIQYIKNEWNKSNK